MRITTLLATTATYAVLRGESTASAAWSATALRRDLAATHVQSCSLETGIDYVGNDIANAPATAASDCCAKCNAQAGCGAFTWTNWNGGTCWLKSYKGSTVAKEGAQSAVVSSFASGESCSTIEAGVDYVSNDIANVHAAAASDCCAKCSHHAGCGAFSWTNWNGGTCWLKSGKGATTANPNAFSAVMLPTGPATPAPTPAPAGVCSGVEQGIDYPGSDIGNVPGNGASDCCTKCTQRSGCGAFTWTNYNGGTCWLKSGKGSRQTLAGAVSGVVTSSPNPNPTVASPPPAPATACPVVEENVDYPGLDIANVTGSGGADCCSKCAQRSGCGAFTWTIHNGGTCWLKSGKGSPQTLAGAVSGVVTSSPNPNPTVASPPPAPATACPVVEENVDYPGLDIANVTGSGGADCCSKCAQRSGCGAFTWTIHNGGTCWLKSGKGSPQTLAGAVSGVVTSSPNPNPTVASPPPAPATACPVVEENVDYPGLDIANVTGSGGADCCSKCAQRSGCGAFTWTIHNGGTCWLKSGKGSPQSLSGAVSGVVANSGTTTSAPMLPNGLATPVELLRRGYSRMRAVNLGGWLVAENWMSLSSPAWTDAGDAADKGEYIAMQRLGKDKGTRQFEEHRATWITENDIQAIAAAGLNSVRVPVGFWIVNDDPSTVASDISRVYAPGALKYLDKLINEWAVKHNLAVMLSLHAHQGSQNGYDHSAPQTFGAITWSDSQANVDNSLQFATFLADRYKNSAAFLGMNLMNEPMYPTNLDVVQAYYLEAYKRIRATGNNCILVTSPPLWNQTPPTMKDFMRSSEFTNVWHEFHTYYRWTHEGKTEAQILDTAKPYRTMVIDPWTGNKLHIGEWSLTGPDSAPFQDKDLLRQFAAIQMTNYAAAPAGWSFWSWRHDEEATKISGWSLRQLLREGILTIPSGEVSA